MCKPSSATACCGFTSPCHRPRSLRIRCDFMNSRAALKQSPPAGTLPEEPLPAPSAAASKPENQGEPKIPDVLPILPLRNLVLFPGTVVPLSIGRPDSIKLLEENLPQSKIIGVIAQRAAEKENPGPDDLYHVGT